MPKFFNVNEKRKNNKIFVTGSVANDFKKTREFYRANIDQIEKAFDIVLNVMNIKDKSLKLFVRNLRKSSGIFYNSRNEVCIDIRRYDLKSIVSTMIHECQHKLQYVNGDLSESSKPNYKKWKNEDVKNANSSKNYEAYLNLPWEIDARNAEKKFIDKVWNQLNDK